VKQISAAFWKILGEDAAVAALVGTRIYRGTPPDVAEGEPIRTAISYELSGWANTDALAGALPSVKQQWIFQVDGDDSDAVDEAVVATRVVLHQYKGSVATTQGTVLIHGLSVDNVRGEFTGVTGYHQRFLEVTVAYRVTA
jgi:hypothetical protein